MNEVMKELRPANPPSYEVTYELHNFYKPILFHLSLTLVLAMLHPPFVRPLLPSRT
jgi:hypothetical protein